MDIVSLDLPEVKILSPSKFGDARGFFSETYNRDAFAAAGLDHVFVQDNHSFSATPGTLRGLHFQLPPYAQDKLVRVTRGAIFDVFRMEQHAGAEGLPKARSCRSACTGLV